MNFTKTLLAGALLLAAPTAAFSQEHTASKLTINMDMRGDFTYEDIEGEKTHSGFHGRFLNVRVDGQIMEGLTFSVRQRLNKFGNFENDVFSATDWAWVSYQFNPKFSVAAGKQVVMIGGYEYDAAPIDIFFASRFWNNIACYQFGASTTWYPNGNNAVTFQICNSPYKAMASSTYAYNLYWSGNFGVYRTLWSVNMIEYERGEYANFIALGNRFTFDIIDFQLDLMNRATRHQKFLFSDYSVIANLDIKATDWMTVNLKGGYDKFREIPGAPYHQDHQFYGGGFQFYPLQGSRDLRLHLIGANYYDNQGTRHTEIMAGVKWAVNLVRK